MPRLWKEEAKGKFIAIPLDARERSRSRRSCCCSILPANAVSGHFWPARIRPPPRINGESLVMGMRVLRDRDLIQLADDAAAIFFSTDSAP